MEAVPVMPADISMLPDEILLQIFSHIELEDLLHAANVCRRWDRLLKGGKSLWSQKEFRAKDATNVKELLKITTIMPRFTVVRLIRGTTYLLHIAWPLATVFLPGGAAPEDLTSGGAFICKRILVSAHLTLKIKNCLKWVKRRTLRSIHVGDHCFDYSLGCEVTFSSRMQHSCCSVWKCLVHSKSPLLYKIPSSRTKGTPSSDGAVCPALEHLSVCCSYLPQENLEGLCRLGPIRDLRVICSGLRSLSFLNSCAAHLEVLSVVDPSNARAAPLQISSNTQKNSKP